MILWWVSKQEALNVHAWGSTSRTLTIDTCRKPSGRVCVWWKITLQVLNFFIQIYVCFVYIWCFCYLKLCFVFGSIAPVSTHTNPHIKFHSLLFFTSPSSFIYTVPSIKLFSRPLALLPVLVFVPSHLVQVFEGSSVAHALFCSPPLLTLRLYTSNKHYT